MSTRSTIALEFADGTVQQVYCHADGYLDYNGEMLLKHWSDPFKLRDLIEQGALSSLGEEVGVKHPWDALGAYGSVAYLEHKAKFGKMCRFYGRDRGEEDQSASKFWNFEMYRTSAEWQEYDYILRTDGKWYVGLGDGKFVELETALKETA
jgi:hypothetical protein